MIDSASLKTRVSSIKESIRGEPDKSGLRWGRNIQGGVQGTLSVLSAVYGPQSHQVRSFQNRLVKGVGRHDDTDHRYDHRIAGDIDSSLDAAIEDLEAGINSLSGLLAAGEVLGDFATLARQALDVNSEAADRVAAVLVAASLEEAFKQVGIARGLDVQGREMRGVLEKLKQVGVLAGAQFSLAHGFVGFRDKALHAQFEEISRGTTESALTFVEGFLTQEFS